MYLDEQKSSRVDTGPRKHSSFIFLGYAMLVISLVALLTLADQMQDKENYTEFFIENGDELIKEGIPSLLHIKVINHEGDSTGYRVLMKLNGQTIYTGDPFDLKENETHVVPLEVPLDTPISNEVVEIWLLREGFPDPYRQLFFRVNLTPTSEMLITPSLTPIIPTPTATRTSTTIATETAANNPSKTPTAKLTEMPTATAQLLDPCLPPADWVQYSVRTGDTLWGLSRQVRVTVQKLRSINCLASNNLRVGQVLYLPFRPATYSPVYPNPIRSITQAPPSSRP